MNTNKTSRIIVASCLALVALVFFQVNWLNHSRRLLEEQFDQKVTMALCSAVDQMSREKSFTDLLSPTAPPVAPTYNATCLPPDVDQTELHSVLRSSLKRYNINCDFQFAILPEMCQPATSAAYCSTMAPITQNNQAIQLQLIGKDEYVIQQMGFMAGSSILILLSICFLFGITLIRLLQQRKLNVQSVDFFNNMAHEFRTPLTNMNLALNLLCKRQPEAIDNKFVQVIRSENARLMEQVERILTVAKLEKGEYQLEKQPLDIQELVRGVVEDMQIQATERGGNIYFEPTDTGQNMLSGDPLHLSNAIRNLVDNAIKYSETSPKIRIQCNHQAHQVHISIQDHGIGISEQQRSFIFEKFRRVDPGDVHDKKGFGLGLAYVKRIVELHHGHIRLESKAGEGTVFHLFLPLVMLNTPDHV